MIYFVKLENNVVVGAMYGSTPQDPTWIEVDTDIAIRVGMVYDPETETFDDTNLLWEEVRIIRNRLLAETDWTQLNDVVGNRLTVEQAESYTTYRQALADIPQNFSNPEEVIWPTKPL